MTVEAQVKEVKTEDDQTMVESDDETANADASVLYSENLSIETATADVQRALEEYQDEFPYANHFHPATESPILGFDPNLVQDQFDSYDINDFVDFGV
jgi:hypothetical protein